VAYLSLLHPPSFRRLPGLPLLLAASFLLDLFPPTPLFSAQLLLFSLR
jgi:hypothetical protein